MSPSMPTNSPPIADPEAPDAAHTRAILPAAVVARSDHHADFATPHRQRPTPKRTSITPVACRPCQQRKHKCDGLRPVCSPCLVKKRADCCYDAAGDQRRTSALKQRIRDLTKETGDLKDVITGIGTAADKDAATAIARQLNYDGFGAVGHVAQAFRRDDGAADIFKGMTKNASQGSRGDESDWAMLQPSPASAGVTDIQEADANDTGTMAMWPLDMAVEDGDLAQVQYGNPQYQVSAAFWPTADSSVSPEYSLEQTGPSGQTVASADGTDAESIAMINSFVPGSEWYTHQ